MCLKCVQRLVSALFKSLVIMLCHQIMKITYKCISEGIENWKCFSLLFAKWRCTQIVSRKWIVPVG